MKILLRWMFSTIAFCVIAVVASAETNWSGRLYFGTIEDFDPTNTKDSSLGGGFADGRTAMQAYIRFDRKTDLSSAYVKVEADKATLAYVYEGTLTAHLAKAFGWGKPVVFDATAATGFGTNKYSRIGYFQFSRIYDRVGDNISTGIGTDSSGKPFAIGTDVGIAQATIRLGASPGYWVDSSDSSDPGREDWMIPVFAGVYGRVAGVLYETYYTYKGDDAQSFIVDGTYSIGLAKGAFVTVGAGLSMDLDFTTSDGDDTDDWLYYGLDLLWRFKSLGLTVETGARGNVDEEAYLTAAGIAAAYGLPFALTLKTMVLFDLRQDSTYALMNAVGAGLQRKFGMLTLDFGYFIRGENAAPMGDLGVDRTFLTVLKGIDSLENSFYVTASVGF